MDGAVEKICVFNRKCHVSETVRDTAKVTVNL